MKSPQWYANLPKWLQDVLSLIFILVFGSIAVLILLALFVGLGGFLEWPIHEVSSSSGSEWISRRWAEVTALFKTPLSDVPLGQFVSLIFLVIWFRPR